MWAFFKKIEYMINSKNLPNALSLFRLLASILFPALLVLAVPFDLQWLNYSFAILFILIALSDFFDGFFARRFNVESYIGKALDHIADKFLCVSIFLALACLHKILFFTALIFILREIFILSLRNIALVKGFNVHVSMWGKCKTAAQYCLIPVAIVNRHKDFNWENNISVLQICLTLIAIFLSLYSSYLYFIKFKENLLGE